MRLITVRDSYYTIIMFLNAGRIKFAGNVEGGD